MSTPTWNGPYHRGAMRERREIRRLQAEARNAATPANRRRVHRDGPVHQRQS